MKPKKVTQAELAKKLSRNQSTVSRWLKDGPPAEEVIRLEKLTGISRHKLRPDIYPEQG